MGRLLTISYSQEMVCISEVVRKGNRLFLSGMWKRELPEGCVVDGEICDADAMAQIWKEIRRSGNIRTRNVCIVLSSERVISREAHLPHMSRAKTENAIWINQDLYFPIPLTGYALAFYRTGHESHLIASAVPDRMVQACFDTAVLAQLNVISVCDEGAVWYQLLSREEGGEDVLFLCPSGEQVLLSRFSEGEMLYQRRIRKEDLIREMVRTLNYDKKRFPSHGIRHYVYYADEKKESAVIQSLEKILDIRIEVRCHPECICTEYLGNVPAGDAKTGAAGYDPGVGAAFMKKYLLSGKRRQFQMRRLRRNWICMDLAFLILLAVTLMMPPVLRYTKAVAENRDLKSRILILDSENELPEEYERAAECYEHVCKIWELSGAQEMEQEIFSRLLDCWDDRGIYLESLVFEDGRIHLRAETENHEDAVSMVRDLKMQNSISEVYVGAIEKRKTSLSFSITCELADGWGNAKGVCEEYGTVDGQEQTMVDAPDSIAASDTGLAGDCTVPDGADGAIDGRKSQAETGI